MRQDLANKQTSTVQHLQIPGFSSPPEIYLALQNGWLEDQPFFLIVGPLFRGHVNFCVGICAQKSKVALGREGKFGSLAICRHEGFEGGSDIQDVTLYVYLLPDLELLNLSQSPISHGANYSDQPAEVTPNGGFARLFSPNPLIQV